MASSLHKTGYLPYQPAATHAVVRFRHISEPLPSFKQGNSVLDDRGSIPDQDSYPDVLISTPYCYRFWDKRSSHPETGLRGFEGSGSLRLPDF
jgi:hypothetical protein